MPRQAGAPGGPLPTGPLRPRAWRVAQSLQAQARQVSSGSLLSLNFVLDPGGLWTDEDITRRFGSFPAS